MYILTIAINNRDGYTVKIGTDNAQGTVSQPPQLPTKVDMQGFSVAPTFKLGNSLLRNFMPLSRCENATSEISGMTVPARQDGR